MNTLWTCPECGHRFVTRNAQGPVEVIPQKTRIAIASVPPPSTTRLRLDRPEDAGRRLRALIAGAYRVGLREHLKR